MSPLTVILVLAFLAVVFYLVLRFLGGGDGPVIVITPVPEQLGAAPKALRAVKWEVGCGPATAVAKAVDVMPDRLFYWLGVRHCEYYTMAQPAKAMKFRSLQLEIGAAKDLLIFEKHGGGGALGWIPSWNFGGKDLLGAAKLTMPEWPSALLGEVSEIVIDDQRFAPGEISKIEIRYRKKAFSSQCA